MKRFCVIFLLLLFCLAGRATERIRLADPTIFFEGGIYYLYGTGADADQGFQVYVSKDLRHWQGPAGAAADGYALKRGDTFGHRGFWAPQLFRYRGRYYMAYTADEQIAIAVADSPLGPFTQTVKRCLPSDRREIDPYVFFDRDGKIYLYHVRLEEGNRIFVAELDEHLAAIRPGTLRECLSATEPWEDTAQAAWRVTEGPTVVRRDSLYYLFYSANDFRNIDYAVGYATAVSPLGPWHKQSVGPILSRRQTGENGSGHGDLFTATDGTLRYVFHTHATSGQVAPRQTAIVTLEAVKGPEGERFRIVPGSLFFPVTEDAARKEP